MDYQTTLINVKTLLFYLEKVLSCPKEKVGEEIILLGKKYKIG